MQKGPIIGLDVNVELWTKFFGKDVKIIGATAHYVTKDLDEGPIIEQETIRVNHSMSVNKLIEMGKDIESTVLSKAIKLHCEKRIFLNDNKTVIFE